MKSKVVSWTTVSWGLSLIGMLSKHRTKWENFPFVNCKESLVWVMIKLLDWMLLPWLRSVLPFSHHNLWHRTISKIDKLSSCPVDKMWPDTWCNLCQFLFTPWIWSCLSYVLHLILSINLSPESNFIFFLMQYTHISPLTLHTFPTMPVFHQILYPETNIYIFQWLIIQLT